MKQNFRAPGKGAPLAQTALQRGARERNGHKAHLTGSRVEGVPPSHEPRSSGRESAPSDPGQKLEPTYVRCHGSRVQSANIVSGKSLHELERGNAGFIRQQRPPRNLLLDESGVPVQGFKPSSFAGERGSQTLTPKANVESDHWLIWQLVDSAFPTGGFAHSAGLEAAWQHGEVRNRGELLSFLEANLNQLGRAALPFVTTAWDEPERFPELDDLCDVFTTNHVANRASRSQGKALLTAVERIFLERGFQAASARTPGPTSFSHFAPVFGACLRALEVARDTTVRMFFFNHLRGLVAAAVRLNIVGPMEAQKLQHRLSTRAENILIRCEALTLNDLTQTAPLLDLWQGAQDRLYSRLFRS